MAVAIEQIKREIQQAIDSDPTLGDSSNISVMTESSGVLFAKKERIVLTGAVRNDNDKKRIEEIARQKAGSKEIINKLKISR